MASEETTLHEGAIGTETEAEEPAPRLSLDELRLRLDSPLFARDPGMTPSTGVPRLRELTWEHVVTSQHPIIPVDGEAPPASSLPVVDIPRPRIEDLLTTPAAPAPIVPPAATPPAEPVAEQPAAAPSFTAAPAAPPVAPPPVEPPAALVDPVAAPQAPAPAAPVADFDPHLDDPALRIVNPPPVPRGDDPLVLGLAELIARSTPADGQSTTAPPARPVVTTPAPPPPPPTPPATPVTGTVAPAAPATGSTPHITPARAIIAVAPATGSVPVVRQPAADVAVAAAAAAATAAAATPAAPAPTPAPPPPVSADPVVEAEINRLSFLPDSVDNSGPVEVPAIAVSDNIPAVPTVPPPAAASQPVAATAAPATGATPLPGNLSLAAGEVYAPKSSAAPQASMELSYANLTQQVSITPLKRKRKRHLFRKFVVLLVVLGMIAGGLFAVKKFVLDQRWDSQVKPLADKIAAHTGLSWDHAVDVKVVDVDTYSQTLGAIGLGVDPADQEALDELATEWRALGLLSGELDVAAIGLAAMPDSPAVYDPSSRNIYVVDGLPPQLYEFAVDRALATALFDQHYGWAGRVDDGSRSVAVGSRGLADAAAIEVAQGLVGKPDRDVILGQMMQLYADNEVKASPAPYASVVSGRLGVAAWPYFRNIKPDDRDALLGDDTVDDGDLLDISRLVTNTEQTVSAESQGMLFWYHVLAARVDDELAWKTALTWQQDSLLVQPQSNGCVTGTFVGTAAGSGFMQMAFNAWKDAAPPESTTTVAFAESGGTPRVAVTACDPGATVVTSDPAPRLSLGGAPLRFEQLRQFIEAAPTQTIANAVCVVSALTDPVSLADERGVLDSTAGWAVLANHPPALSTGCTTG